jgi:predicted RND superfamily exporter protein
VIGSLVTGVLWMLALSHGAGIRINFANFIAFPITFGIGVDYAVTSCRAICRTAPDVGAAITSTGSAVALCSATTSSGTRRCSSPRTRASSSSGSSRSWAR